MPLESFLDAICDPSATVSSSDFVEVSDLSPSELGHFARVWFSLSTERQRWLVDTMVELAEDNAELDFCAVFKMCLKDRDELVLLKAIEGLWEYEDRSIIPGLIQILRSDKSAEARASAAVALGKFSLLVQDGKLLTRDADSIHDNLLVVLEDSGEDLEVRRRSLEAVAPFNTRDIAKLVSWAYESGDLRLKSSSIYAMGRTGEPSWIPLFIKELDNSEPAVRYETANACGELGDENVVPHLIGLLEDDDYQVQIASLVAIGKIGGPLAKRALLHCLKEGDASLEEAARVALENVEFLEDPMSFIS